LSADNQTMALVVQPMIGADAEAGRAELLVNIRQSIETLGYDVHLGGYGVVFEGLNEASTTGSATLILAAHFVMLLLLALNFRRALPVLITLISVGAATVWTMGLYAAMGHQLNMVTMVIPTLVLVIGIADCLHVLRTVAAEEPGHPQQHRVIAGVGKIIRPCFLTTITTAAGFLGLTASGLPAVQQLGWFGAFGMVAAFICSMVLMTAALSWRVSEPVARQSMAERVSARLHAFGVSRARSIVVTYVLLAACAGYGMSQLSVDTGSLDYLKRSHPVRQDSEFIESKFGAYVPVEFLVSSDSDILTEENLDAIFSWQKKVLTLDNVKWDWSLVGALGLSESEKPSDIGITEIRRVLERARRFSSVAVGSLLNGDRELRISFGTPILSSETVRTLINDIENLASFPPGLSLKPAGYAPLYTRIIDELVNSQVRGFATALVLIVILLGIGLQSWRRVLLAVPANVIPVGLTLGLMGLMDIPLDVATATIATVILGLVVDDTVHLLRPTGQPLLGDSLKLAARSSGGTLIMTTFILAAGFLVLGLADIRSIAWFGVLTSFAVVVAILTDLLLLPALVRLFSGSSHKSVS
jgi:predicted RND superfamily exporter protein